nr:hypothetical protein [Tanacetum cinerariifolium]
MASFDYRLNPLYPIKECSSCGALYTMDYYCSEGSLGDRIICDLNKTPDLFQEPSRNCPKCGNPVDDSSKPSNDNTNVVNALQEPFVVKQDHGKNSSQSPPQINHNYCYGCGDPLEDIFCHQCTCELCGKGAHYGYNCQPKVPVVSKPKPCHNQTIDKLPQTVPSFDPTCYSEDGNSFTYDSKSNLVHDSPNVFDPPPQLPLYSCEFYGNDARYGHYCIPQILVCYNDDDDDDEDNTIAITHKELDNSLSMGDEHLDTVSEMESDEFINSCIENLVPNPSESEGEHECDVPACEVFTTFSNILFDADYNFSSVDGQSFYDEDIPKEIYLNPLFDEEIISMKIDPHHFNVESDLIESLLNHDSSIISSSLKIDSLFDEFAEIDLFFTSDDPMPPGIEEDDYDSKRDILILEELLSNDSLSLPENESFHFDIPSSSRPPTKPPDGNTRILNVKVMGDIFEFKVPMPRLMITQPTLVLNQEKSPDLLSHQGHEAFQPSTECPMMIYGRNTPILDV